MNTGSFGSKNLSELKNYTWAGVVSFLNEQCKSSEMEKTQWLVEKKQYTERISQLEGELQASEAINKDLIQRVKMLEFSLRQERIKYGKLTGGHHRVNSDVISTILSRKEKNSDSIGQMLPKRRTRAHRQLLSKYLQELGLEDIFTGDLPPRQIHHRPSKSYGSNLQALIELPSENNTTPLPKSETVKINIIEDKSVKKSWELKIALKSHMDVVRSLHFTQKEGILATASEDCLIKLWDISHYDSFNENSQCEPYFSLRGHKKPILTMTGNIIGDEQLLYTAGEEGIIRVWELVPPNDVNAYGPAPDKSYCVGIWSGHSEAIWDLKHHPVDGLVLSSSADGIVKLWKTVDTTTSIENWKSGKNSANLVKNFMYPTADGENYHIPTCASWLITELNSFVVGYTTPYLNIFDKQTGKPSIIRFVKENDVYDKVYQINCIATSNSSNFTVCGHEDKHLRFFDLNSCCCVKDLVGHTDSVSSLWMSGNHLVSGGNDGSLRFWDVRTYQCLQEIPAHRKKYDEGVLCISQHPSFSLMASAGADSLVKLYHNI
ncbi:hypothetical protein SteCoe_6370 [Stentor coeruleus]|uniref:Striatin N-terminal domain-containing protein n=1 Tax=Stentor coeruleus TaxID=5963 RepID=A0A1R2CQ34_9CILI|nr:hypothetical protein SteCoe_6370 [Stentor coeruleus]